MYCPKCSQQQISEEMRFCSRCGFPLEGVKELVAAGGLIEKQDLQSLVDQNSKLFCNVRKSVAMMIAAIPIFIFVGILAGVVSDGFAALILLPVILFLYGFIHLIYITAKERKRRQNEPATKVGQLNTTVLNAQLPPSRVVPVDNLTANRAHTAEMVHPPSVTENTTKLLDEEPASQH